MNTETLAKIFAGCARKQIIASGFIPMGSCVASTAITLDVMAHYGRLAQPWEVCLQIVRPPIHLEVGCYPSESGDGAGGHLVSIVDNFLIDAAFGEYAQRLPHIPVPEVFIGTLNGIVRDRYQFFPSFAALEYRARKMDTDYTTLPDWGPSPQREDAVARIVRRIDGYCVKHGIPV